MLEPLLQHGKEDNVTCGIGWYPLLVELNEKLEAIDSDYSFLYAREKYGMLHVWALPDDYQNKPDDRMAFHELFDDFMDKSRSICEYCGAPGENCIIDNWEKILCDPCIDHVKEEQGLSEYKQRRELYTKE